MGMFTKAQKSSTKLRMALAGPAGSGKTWTALALASELGKRVAMIDTERGGGAHYADQFDFDSLELTSFHPSHYIKALQGAAEERYDVIVVDSLSHAWFGSEGVLQLVDEEARRSQSKNSYFAWRDVTPLQNRLVDALVQSPCHVLVTLRTKTDYIIEMDKHGKQAPKKVGLAPVQRDGLEYEFDIVADLDHQHTLVITKSRIHGLADAVFERPGPELGKHILRLLTTSIHGEVLSADHPLKRQITALLVQQGLTQVQQDAYWVKMGDKFPDLGDPTVLKMLYDQLAAAAEKKGKKASEAVAKDVPGVLPLAPVAPQGRAWDVLREHQDDAQLTPDILEQIGAALTTPASEDEAEKLAGLVMDWLDSREEVEVTI